MSLPSSPLPLLLPETGFLPVHLRKALFDWWLRFVNSSDLMCVKPVTSRKQVLDPTHTVLPYVADRSAAISCWSLKSNELCKWMWIADCLEFSLQFLRIL